MAYADRVKFATATTGTGSITVGAASSGFQLPAAAGIVDGQDVRYVIEDGTAWETGRAVASSTSTVFSRALESSSTGSLLSLSGTATMYFTLNAALLKDVAISGTMLQASISNYAL